MTKNRILAAITILAIGANDGVLAQEAVDCSDINVQQTAISIIQTPSNFVQFVTRSDSPALMQELQHIEGVNTLTAQLNRLREADSRDREDYDAKITQIEQRKSEALEACFNEIRGQWLDFLKKVPGYRAGRPPIKPSEIEQTISLPPESQLGPLCQRNRDVLADRISLPNARRARSNRDLRRAQIKAAEDELNKLGTAADLQAFESSMQFKFETVVELEHDSSINSHFCQGLLRASAKSRDGSLMTGATEIIFTVQPNLVERGAAVVKAGFSN
jgi:hypothetical protein